MKILLVHSGHTFSTADVYDGMAAGLRLAGAQVVEWRLDKAIQLLNELTNAAILSGAVDASRVGDLKQRSLWLASADAVSLALDAEVDAVVVVCGLLFPAKRALLLRKLNIPVACYGTEAPYIDMDLRYAGAYSHWFTNERLSVAQFAAAGPRAMYLPHAYNPAVHRPAPPDSEKQADVVFVGGGFRERKALLDGAEALGAPAITRVGTLWADETDLTGGAVTNDVTSAWHRAARISLNIHRTSTYQEADKHTFIDPAAAESLGPRAYEIPAVGGFMLCDDARPELREVYGESAATYRAGDSADLARQIRYWLSHPDRRDAVAKAQAEAVRPHHWGERATRILDFLTARRPRRRATEHSTNGHQEHASRAPAL